MASWQTIGIWREMIDRMWDAPERGKLTGTPEQIAKVIGCSIDELRQAVKEIKDLKIADINVTKTADVTKSHSVVTIVNRRMSRDEKIRQDARNRKFRQRHKEVTVESRNNVTPNVTLHSSSSSSVSSSKDLKPLPRKKHSEIADPRHYPLAKHIQEVYLDTNGMVCPWDGHTAKVLSNFLKLNRAISLDDLILCVNYRFESDAITVADEPLHWINHLMKYATGPLNQYGKPIDLIPQKPADHQLRVELQAGSRRQIPTAEELVLSEQLKALGEKKTM